MTSVAGVAHAESDAAVGLRRDVVRHAVYWAETESVQPGPPLEGEVRCDVCIVGGGYTGLWAAYLLKREDPALDIRVLEADYAGAGASGHNDGFVTPTIGHSLHTVVRQVGIERARDAYAAIGRSIMELRRFCRREGVDAELEPGGFFLVATNEAQRRRLDRDAGLAADMGVQAEILDGEGARRRIGSAAIQAALMTPGATVNPHRLARGLARAVRALGVEIHECTPVLAITTDRGNHRLVTPLARVAASRMVLATNAYQHRWRRFRNCVKPVWSYAAVTEPLPPERLAAVEWPGREGFVEARNFITFLRLTADDRLLVGGGPAPYYYGRDMDRRRVRDERAFAVLRSELGRYFPSLRDVRFTHAYGGCIAVTRDLIPRVGTTEGGVCHAYGYCGNGIAMSQLAGEALRDLVLGRKSRFTDLFFVDRRPARFPPEPVAFLGARGLSGLLAWQDRHPQLLGRQVV